MTGKLFEWLKSVAGRFSGKSREQANEPTGAIGERIAADYLQKKFGYTILKRGHRNWLGEIDLVVLDKTTRGRKTIVFVEVKTWTHPSEGSPADAVDQNKQQRLTRLALEFLKSRRLLEASARFDIVEVILTPPSIRHIINAFETTGKFQWYS
jgi:putative endonuclease